MIGTLSMYALVALGYSQVNMAAAVIPFALLNAAVGLPRPAPVEGAEPAPCTYAGFNRALPLQMVYTSIGYLLGFGAAALL